MMNANQLRRLERLESSARPPSIRDQHERDWPIQEVISEAHGRAFTYAESWALFTYKPLSDLNLKHAEGIVERDEPETDFHVWLVDRGHDPEAMITEALYTVGVLRFNFQFVCGVFFY